MHLTHIVGGLPPRVAWKVAVAPKFPQNDVVGTAATIPSVVVPVVGIQTTTVLVVGRPTCAKLGIPTLEEQTFGDFSGHVATNLCINLFFPLLFLE